MKISDNSLIEKKLFHFLNKKITIILAELFKRFRNFYLVGGKVIDLLLSKSYCTYSFDYDIHGNHENINEFAFILTKRLNENISFDDIIKLGISEFDRSSKIFIYHNVVIKTNKKLNKYLIRLKINDSLNIPLFDIVPSEYSSDNNIKEFHYRLKHDIAETSIFHTDTNKLLHIHLNNIVLDLIKLIDHPQVRHKRNKNIIKLFYIFNAVKEKKINLNYNNINNINNTIELLNANINILIDYLKKIESNPQSESESAFFEKVNRNVKYYIEIDDSNYFTNPSEINKIKTIDDDYITNLGKNVENVEKYIRIHPSEYKLYFIIDSDMMFDINKINENQYLLFDYEIRLYDENNIIKNMNKIIYENIKKYSNPIIISININEEYVKQMYYEKELYNKKFIKYIKYMLNKNCILHVKKKEYKEFKIYNYNHEIEYLECEINIDKNFDKNNCITFKNIDNLIDNKLYKKSSISYDEEKFEKINNFFNTIKPPKIFNRSSPELLDEEIYTKFKYGFGNFKLFIDLCYKEIIKNFKININHNDYKNGDYTENTTLRNKTEKSVASLSLGTNYKFNDDFYKKILNVIQMKSSLIDRIYKEYGKIKINKSTLFVTSLQYFFNATKKKINLDEKYEFLDLNWTNNNTEGRNGTICCTTSYTKEFIDNYNDKADFKNNYFNLSLTPHFTGYNKYQAGRILNMHNIKNLNFINLISNYSSIKLNNEAGVNKRNSFYIFILKELIGENYYKFKNIKMMNVIWFLF